MAFPDDTGTGVLEADMGLLARLRRAERVARPADKAAYSIWLEDADGFSTGPDGEKMSREDFKRLHPNAIKLEWGDDDDDNTPGQVSREAVR